MTAAIFLDLQGVIFPFSAFRGKEKEDPKANLSSLIEKVLVTLDPHIIITSSMRLGRSIQEIREVYFPESIIGNYITDKVDDRHDVRGRLIQDYLKNHRFDRFVIFDDNDEEISKLYSDHFVQVNGVFLLQKKDIEQGISILLDKK